MSSATRNTDASKTTDKDSATEAPHGTRVLVVTITAPATATEARVTLPPAGSFDSPEFRAQINRSVGIAAAVIGGIYLIIACLGLWVYLSGRYRDRRAHKYEMVHDEAAPMLANKKKWKRGSQVPAAPHVTRAMTPEQSYAPAPVAPPPAAMGGVGMGMPEVTLTRDGEFASPMPMPMAVESSGTRFDVSPPLGGQQQVTGVARFDSVSDESRYSRYSFEDGGADSVIGGGNHQRDVERG